MGNFKFICIVFLYMFICDSHLFAQCSCSPSSCSITASIAYEGTAAQGDYSIFLAPGNTTLTNPIIVVEGLDIYNSVGCQQFAESGILLVLNGAGYDVVFLNFANNTDYIERNAYLVVELLTQLQTTMSNNNQFIVSGINTGAVVARYALAYMEANGLNHNTKCYLSIDGPQAGLNIPIGLQIWYNFVSTDVLLEFSIAGTSLTPPLNTPMLKQLLYCFGTASQSAGFPTPDPAYTSFFAELRGLNSCYGYPEKCKKIAVSLGSIDGTTQINADLSTSVSGKPMFSFFYDATTGNNLPVNTSWLGAVSGWVNIVIDENYASIFPTGTVPATCLYQDFSYEDFWVPTGFTTPSQLRPYDNCPGSYNNDLIDATQGFLAASINLTYCPPPFFDKATFVPTVSAFDVNTTDFYFDFSSNLPIESVSPFDKCYSAGANDYYNDIESLYDVFTSTDLASQIASSGGYEDCAHMDATIPPSTINSGSSDAWNVSQNLTVNNYTVENGGTTNLYAGSNIFVEPGFVSNKGSFADLAIVPCTYKVCAPPAESVPPPHVDQQTSILEAQNMNAFNLKIFPNPTTDVLQVSLTNGSDPEAIVRISDLSGVIISQLPVGQDIMNINVANFAEGTYFLTYLNRDQNVTKKFSIVR